MHTVDSYTTTERDKTRRIIRLLLSNGESKSLTVIGSINIPITHTQIIWALLLAIVFD